jgi:hypothetical protein
LASPFCGEEGESSRLGSVIELLLHHSLCLLLTPTSNHPTQSLLEDEEAT